MDDKFQAEAFRTAGPQARSDLARELAEHMKERLRAARGPGTPEAAEARFHETVYALVEELRGLGHDLWSFDESGDSQEWGPDYVRGGTVGLYVTCTLDGEVDVFWREA